MTQVERSTNLTAVKGNLYDFEWHSLVEISEIARSLGYPGARFFVDRDNGTDSATRTGQANEPFATVDWAMGQVSSGRGDVIVLIPSANQFDESANVGGVVCDKQAVLIMGYGRATQCVNSNALAESVFKITANDVTLLNIAITETTNTVNGVEVTATLPIGAKILDCIIIGAQENNIRLNNATNCQIRRCRLESAVNDSIELSGTASNNIIRDNVIRGANNYAIHLNGANVQQNYIIDNDISGFGGVTDTGIYVDSGTSNIIHGNRCGECASLNWFDSGLNNLWNDNHGAVITGSFICEQTLSGLVVSVTGLIGYDTGSNYVHVGLRYAGFTLAQTLNATFIQNQTTALSRITDMDSFIVGTDSVTAVLSSPVRGGNDAFDVQFTWVTIPADITMTYDVSEVR